MSSSNKQQAAWEVAIGDAKTALNDLLDIQTELQERYDEMTEDQQGGVPGQVLRVICDLDISGALDMLEEAETFTLP